VPEPRPSTTPLPLVRRAPSLEPPTEDLRAPLRLVPRRAEPARTSPQPPSRPVPLPVDPAATVLVSRILALALEVRDGRRSPQQLRTLLTPALVQMVTTRARQAVGSGHRPGRLRPVHVQAVTPTVVEANGVVRRERDSHAVAARLELVGRTWRCTALWLG
jgi:hypothetical protein